MASLLIAYDNSDIASTKSLSCSGVRFDNSSLIFVHAQPSLTAFVFNVINNFNQIINEDKSRAITDFEYRFVLWCCA